MGYPVLEAMKHLSKQDEMTKGDRRMTKRYWNQQWLLICGIYTGEQKQPIRHRKAKRDTQSSVVLGPFVEGSRMWRKRRTCQCYQHATEDSLEGDRYFQQLPQWLITNTPHLVDPRSRSVRGIPHYLLIYHRWESRAGAAAELRHQQQHQEQNRRKRPAQPCGVQTEASERCDISTPFSSSTAAFIQFTMKGVQTVP
ncbi:hypothetical protein FQN60_009974 [Etheostoma spectabile]|uniref:Uncharacterized protein n=1 Tax=Etheostoma spectabile TaxID=54343 RepID=A0A5J5D587_9PERO|nr:hypothetical protein FQN60_009974 [Etheostoma spectabile]